MRYLISLCVVFLLAASSAEGLKCNEGFNMSMSGIPFYHWKERECAANSKCFGQEMMVKLPLGDLKFDVTMKYGACLSSAYADYLDCNKLFGPDSTLDPADLLDLIPDIVDRFNATVQDFVTNIMLELKTLLSNGQGTREFVDGIFAFYTNMGFNMEKAEPLKPSLATLLEKVFGGKQQEIGTAAAKVINDFANLDTANPKLTNALKKLISAIDSTYDVSSNPAVSAMVEKGPGLVRSILPTNWNVSLWYDVIFELMDDINPNNWTKTAEDMVKTIKSSYDIPADILAILNPTFDRIPALAAGSQTNPAYIGIWSLDLLKAYSEVDSVTTNFANALINFVEKVGNITLQQEYRTTIERMPGLMYKIFPNNKTLIQDIYTKMANGFNAFNFTDLTDTAAPTKLSTFLISFIQQLLGGQPLDSFAKAAIINFSKMTYDLLSDYANYLDIFADVMTDGFKDFPKFDVGSIMEKLIEGMGGTVPNEVKPLFSNIQTVIDAAMKQQFNVSDLYAAFTTVIEAYKTAYPSSPFPELVQRYINIIKAMVELNWKDPTAGAVQFQNQMDLIYWSIDFQFALYKMQNGNLDEFDQMIIKIFPEYETYFKLMTALNGDDVKELVKKIVDWAGSGTMTGTLTPESFVTAVKPTVKKITASMTNLLGDIRKVFAPDTCKFGSCDTELCNDQGFINARPAVTKAPSKVVTTSTTTASGERIHYNLLLNIAAMWMACKAFFG